MPTGRGFREAEARAKWRSGIFDPSNRAYYISSLDYSGSCGFREILPVAVMMRRSSREGKLQTRFRAASMLSYLARPIDR